MEQAGSARPPALDLLPDRTQAGMAVTPGREREGPSEGTQEELGAAEVRTALSRDNLCGGAELVVVRSEAATC